MARQQLDEVDWGELEDQADSEQDEGDDVEELELADREPTDAELAVRAIYRLAESARRDPADFYSFVIRHEITKRKLGCAPHQQVLFSFVMHHSRSVIRAAIGTGKTFSMAALALYFLGEDNSSRGAVVSKSSRQAEKPIGMVADYITQSPLNEPLAIVFPDLKPRVRPTEKWTNTELTVDRPPGIRDSSLRAIGIDGSIGGSRLDWYVADDILDLDNTLTPDLRHKTEDKFISQVDSRLEPGGRAVVTNSPWDREDLTYYLESIGWATLQMDIYGDIKVSNADANWMHMAEQTMLRPAIRDGYYRLRAHDPDPDEEVPLFPERYSADTIREIRYGVPGRIGQKSQQGMPPHEFARLYLCEPFDPKSMRCQRSWVEKCKKRGVGTGLVANYAGDNPTFTGLDLAIGQLKKHDRTVFFTFELLPDRSRRILDIEGGKWSGPEIVDKIGQKCTAYKSMLSVESVAAQDYIRQFALKANPDLMVRPFTTNKHNKHATDFGVESVFTEMSNAAWIIPCELEDNSCHPEVQRWIDGMVYYQPPPAHTSDYLMACWFAREASRGAMRTNPRMRRDRRGVYASAQHPGGF